MQKLTTSLVDMPPLDLNKSRDWMSPFTAQYEAGEWDWEDTGPSWYEVESSPEAEDRKDR